MQVSGKAHECAFPTLPAYQRLNRSKHAKLSGGKAHQPYPKSHSDLGVAPEQTAAVRTAALSRNRALSEKIAGLAAESHCAIGSNDCESEHNDCNSSASSAPALDELDSNDIDDSGGGPDYEMPQDPREGGWRHRTLHASRVNDRGSAAGWVQGVEAPTRAGEADMGGLPLSFGTAQMLIDARRSDELSRRADRLDGDVTNLKMLLALITGAAVMGFLQKHGLL